MNCKITEQQTRQIMRLDGDVTHRKSRYTQPLVIRSIGDVKICVTMISLDDTSKTSRVCYIIDMERAWSDAARHTQRANRRKIQQT